jgi:uncharacterized protein
MDIHAQLAEEFNLHPSQIENTVKLVDEGATIPFIARYRKEMTGGIDDQRLREIFDRLTYLRGFGEKCEQIRKTITEQGNMTDEISARLNAAATLTELDDIYRPYRPKRRTRATVAKEKGLEGLALLIYAQETKQPLEAAAAMYVSGEKGVADAGEALNGAADIVAEILSDDANIRAYVRRAVNRDGYVVSRAAANAGPDTVYANYYDFSEPVSKIAGHRVLAINRGEKEKILNAGIEQPEEAILAALKKMLVKPNPITREIMAAITEDSYKRLIAPSIEREARSALTEKAEEGAIKVFAANLTPLLMQPPIRDKVVLAIDPGFRTGCKTAVINGTGKVLSTGVIYPTAPLKKTTEARAALLPQIDKYGVRIIVVGNGTASRETEQFVVELIRDSGRDLKYIIVDESGASVYSASKLGAAEFPDYDVALRSAVSLGRRLQDPLAELVKIEPKSIGVGQYQHDMNQKRLDETLGGVVEDCVNNVGVDVNTASPSLLSYVSGITPSVAKNILSYREENGPFSNRAQLKKVKGLGPKAYEQCAGFLRIAGGTQPLDNTGVHPESYPVAEGLIKLFGYIAGDVRNGRLSDIKKRVETSGCGIAALAKSLNVGVPTLTDIINDLEKPGRDPREDVTPPVLRADVLDVKDLSEGMILRGTVRNVTDFGAFVDIGVHDSGLVHISEIADRYIKHPTEALSIGQVVTVKVISVDAKRGRIALSIKKAANGS